MSENKKEMIGKAIFGKNWGEVKFLNGIVRDIERIVGKELTDDQRSEIFTNLAMAYNEGQSAMGKKGGSAKTDAKSSASRENGKLGGRPKKVKEE